jgi:hypothetical protein
MIPTTIIISTKVNPDGRRLIAAVSESRDASVPNALGAPRLRGKKSGDI